MVTTGDHDLVVMVELHASHIIKLRQIFDKIKYRVDMKFNVKSHYLQLWPWPLVCMIELCVLHTLAVS